MREILDSDSSFETDSLVTDEEEVSAPKKEEFTKEYVMQKIAEAISKKNSSPVGVKSTKMFDVSLPGRRKASFIVSPKTSEVS